MRLVACLLILHIHIQTSLAVQGRINVPALRPAYRDQRCPVCTEPEQIGTTSLPLVETSGLAASYNHPGIYYAINDSPVTPQIHVINAHGDLIQTIDIQGVETMQGFGKGGHGDWEALATGPCDQTAEVGGRFQSCIFVGDFGHNCARDPCKWKRRVYSVIRLPEPSNIQSEVARIPGQRFWFKYPDGDYDAESLMMTRHGRLYLVTKVNAGYSGVYAFPPFEVGNTIVLSKIARVQAPLDGSPKFTGGDFAVDSQNQTVGITLRTYTHVLYYPVHSGENLWRAVERPPCRLPSPQPKMKQSEVIVWDLPSSSSYLVTSEAPGSRIMRVHCGGISKLAGKAVGGNGSGATSRSGMPWLFFLWLVWYSVLHL